MSNDPLSSGSWSIGGDAPDVRISLTQLKAAKVAADWEKAAASLEAAINTNTEAVSLAAERAEKYATLWQRWKIEFCLTATDEEIAEADRLFFSK